MTLRAARVLLLLALVPAFAAGAEEKVDLAAVHRIKREAFQNSRVMDHLFYLTDVNGPRLTGSPGYAAAAAWAVRSLKGWGLADARTEGWGTFGRGWEVTRFAAHLKEPVYAPLVGVPKAWSGGTNGPVRAKVVSAPLFTAAETRRQDDFDIPTLHDRIARYVVEQKGKLRGAAVLIDDLPEPEPEKADEKMSQRYDDPGLASIALAPEPFLPLTWTYPLESLPADEKTRQRLLENLPDEVGEEYYVRWVRERNPLNAFLRDEGVAAVLSSNRNGDAAGIVFATSAGSWEKGAPIPPPVIALPPEEYARLVRLTERGIPATIEVEVAVAFHDDDPEGKNVVAEIPGGKKKDEVVMLGAHLDSWHGGTGATDNAAGCAVVLEAVRILRALDMKMDRTVRVALWSGEEQGMFGSRGYVRKHFGDPVTMKLEPEQARLSGYFNVDNGTGKVRGVYLQGNDMMRPVFEAWIEPFRDLGATTLAIADTTETDHVSFDAVGLPGFQFIQDPLDYETRTHHSNLDVYDHVQPGDLMQASAILASFVYNTATRPEMLPRKPLPPPLPRAAAAKPDVPRIQQPKETRP